jgi:hypothetical protein
MNDYYEYTAKQHKQRTLSPLFLLAMPMLVAGLCAASFYGGTAFQKSHDKSLLPQTVSGVSAFGTVSAGTPESGTKMMAEAGTVTAVSDTSISVQSGPSGTAKTYTIDTATKIMNAGAAGSLSNIKVGDMVLIETTGDNSELATRVVLNPATLSTGSGMMTQSYGVSTGSARIVQ